MTTHQCPDCGDVTEDGACECPPKRKAGDIYARIIRAAHRGDGIRLSAEDVYTISHDDALIMAALGGDRDGEPAQWLTPAERRRILSSEESAYRHIFRPGREVTP